MIGMALREGDCCSCWRIEPGVSVDRMAFVRPTNRNRPSDADLRHFNLLECTSSAIDTACGYAVYFSSVACNPIAKVWPY
jgi:hypothetical protein